MRTLQRNKRDVYYALYLGQVEEVDEQGFYSGEKTVRYGEPVRIRANVSPAKGYSDQEIFGNLTDYDRVIVTDDVSCPINENSVVFIDTAPTPGGGVRGYDYIVRRVAPSFNGLSIAVRRVDVDVP